jgi:mRNA-degrading endonuclease YafQ of YafQ-DinJ toxin-antitoxin module
VRRLFTRPGFEHKLAKVLRKKPGLADRVERCLKQLIEDPFEPSLSSHKLKGKLAGIWSCSIDFEYRITFEFQLNDETGENDISLISVGVHADVY